MRKISCFILVAVLIVCSCLPAFAGGKTAVRDYLVYPKKAVTEFDEELFSTVNTQPDYVANRGYDRTSLFVSPYWECTADGTEIPVYASMCYDRELDNGLLHSYCLVLADFSACDVSFELVFCDNVENAVVLPQTPCEISGNKVSFKTEKSGEFTVLVNNDDLRRVITVLVKDYVDEDEQIDALQNKYGAEKVLVFDKKYYELDCIELDDYSAVFFRTGAFVSANHIYDILSEEDDKNASDRPTFFNFYEKDGFDVLGYGTLDFTKIDRGEMGEVIISSCKNGRVDGLICLNSPGWTVVTYDCENVELADITVLGYRTNSDGINVCCSRDMTVHDSFIRTGDDCISVKTTSCDLPSKNIEIYDCSAMASKARCFGITGEIYSDISDVTFYDCTVCYRDAVWDNNMVSSLSVSQETGGATASNILFDNIYIYHDAGRPIVCRTVSGIDTGKIENVTFRNITANSEMDVKLYTAPTDGDGSKFLLALSKIADFFRLTKFSDFLVKQSGFISSVNVIFDNVNINGETVGKMKNTPEIEGNASYSSDSFC